MEGNGLYRAGAFSTDGAGVVPQADGVAVNVETMRAAGRILRFCRRPDLLAQAGSPA